MSLDNIQLPSIVIADLFKNSLVELNNNEFTPPQNEPSAPFTFLGKNAKNVVILVNDADAVYLKEEELSFLLGILSACGLTMADVALINLCKNSVTYTLLKDNLQAQTILLFGLTPTSIDLPLDFPAYQIQQYNGQKYLHAPTLANLIGNKAEKTKLWTSLKTLFSIA